MNIRIGTRKSRLARWQSNAVRDALRAADLAATIVEISSDGDDDRVSPLMASGVTGFFTKRIQDALATGAVDIAVHSLKDLPSETPAGLALAAVLARADPRDALICNTGHALADLPTAPSVITGSPRRRAQVLAARPDATFDEMRGNVPTRLDRFRHSRANAMILAAAGLHRLGLEAAIAGYIEPSVMLPAPGQGIIGIECRESDSATRELLARINDARTMAAARAERALMRGIGGGCSTPVGALAETDDTRLILRAVVLSPDGRHVIRDTIVGDLEEPEALGRALAERMLSNGAGELLAPQATGSAP